MPLKDVPVFLRDMIMRLVATNIGKLEGTMNLCIQVGDFKPFPKKQKVVVSSIVVRRVGWTNKMCLGGKGWMFDVLPTMILNPIMLVDCIVLPIFWMANVKFK